MMTRFLTDEDYTTILRDEIREILLEGYSESKLTYAERMAQDQIRNYLAGYYDVDRIFMPIEDGGDDERNAHIVMVTMDCTLYHLYTSLAPDKIPSHRAERYEDAMKWLRDVGRGHASADLPKPTDENGGVMGNILISSEYRNEDNRW